MNILAMVIMEWLPQLPQLPLEIWAVIADFLLHCFDYVGFAAVSVNCNRAVRRAICNLPSKVVQARYGADACEIIECAIGELTADVKLSHIHGFYDIGTHPWGSSFDYMESSRQCGSWQCAGCNTYDKGQTGTITRIVPNTLALRHFWCYKLPIAHLLIAPPPARVLVDLFFGHKK